jgi:cysteine-rich repeat protein
MESVEMAYSWANPTGGEVTEDVQPVAGLVPVDGTQAVAFTPIRLDYISSALAGRTAGLTLVFRGHTVDGYAVQTAPISGVTLSINSCTTSSVCGNGVISGPEACDDGDIDSGDGCAASCQIESGWICSGQPSVCTPLIP